MNIQINKTMGFDPMTGDMVTDTGDLDDNYKEIRSSLPYRFYHLTSPFLKEFDEEMWKKNPYSKKTETRDFLPKNVQYCVLRRNSDTAMNLSPMSLKDLNEDILEKQRKPSTLNISLQQDYSFARAQPADALDAFYMYNRSLNYDYLNDCLTGKELAQWATFDCGLIKDKSLSHTIIFT